MRFQQLFGDTDRFALSVAIRDDPSPPADASPSLVRSWGDLELWVDGVCLTQYTYEGASGSAVTWYLLPFFEWLDANAVELLNREPFAFPIPPFDAGTATVWLDSASEGKPAKATDWTEDAWYDNKYAFWNAHALRAGMPGAAVPHVVFHRVGDHIEISWDNEGAPPARRGLRYANPSGARLVDGAFFAATLREALGTVMRWMNERAVPVEFKSALANGHSVSRDAWTLLLPTRTAELAQRRPALAAQLAKPVPALGAFVPHSLASSVLRGINARGTDDLNLVEAFIDTPPTKTLSHVVTDVFCASPPPRFGAWRSAYQAAERVRQGLGWGVGALSMPDLSGRLERLGIEVKTSELPPETECAAVTFASRRARIVVGRTGRMSPTMKLATALGHLVLDLPNDRPFGVVSSHWTDGPTVARAKAFGAMLLMPAEQCRAIATQGHSGIDLVNAVMQAFQTTRTATAWHLYHLRLVDEDDVEAVRFGSDPGI